MIVAGMLVGFAAIVFAALARREAWHGFLIISIVLMLAAMAILGTHP